MTGWVLLQRWDAKNTKNNNFKENATTGTNNNSTRHNNTPFARAEHQFSFWYRCLYPVCTGKTVPSICHLFFLLRNPPPETNDRIIPPNDRHVLHRQRRRARYVIYDGMMMMLLYCFCAKGAYAFAVHWLPIILRDETKWWLTLVDLDNAARLTRSRIKRESRYVPMCSPVRKSRFK